MKYFQLFRITGVANAITYDDGLKSTETEKKKLVQIHVQLKSQAATDDNDIQGWHERAKVCEFPEYMFPLQENSATPTNYGTMKMTTIPVDIDIPVGEAFKIALKCAATATGIRGTYEYEIIA